MGLVLLLIKIYSMGLFVYIILSWVPSASTVQLRQKVSVLYEPLLQPISQLLNPIQKNIGLDFSPWILFILLNLLQKNLINIFG